jgi:hypothetical protein
MTSNRPATPTEARPHTPETPASNEQHLSERKSQWPVHR